MGVYQSEVGEPTLVRGPKLTVFRLNMRGPRQGCHPKTRTSHKSERRKKYGAPLRRTPPSAASRQPAARYRKAARPPGDTAPLALRSLAADGYVTVLTGEGGEGKSFLTLALAKAVAEGGSAAGVACRAGRSVIFDAENGEQLMARRLQAARIPREGVAVYDADGFDIRRQLDEFRTVIRDERAGTSSCSTAFASSRRERRKARATIWRPSCHRSVACSRDPRRDRRSPPPWQGREGTGLSREFGDPRPDGHALRPRTQQGRRSGRTRRYLKRPSAASTSSLTPGGSMSKPTPPLAQ